MGYVFFVKSTIKSWWPVTICNTTHLGEGQIKITSIRNDTQGYRWSSKTFPMTFPDWLWNDISGCGYVSTLRSLETLRFRVEIDS